MELRIHKPGLLTAALMAVYILSQNLLYLAPEHSFYNYLAYGLVLGMAGYVIFWARKLRLEKSALTLLMAAPLGLSVMASLVEVARYGDASFLHSLYGQMQWWIYGLAFFVFQYALRRHPSVYPALIGGFVFLAVVQVGIGIAQSLLAGQVSFTYIPTTKRLGMIRYYFPVVLMVLAYFWALNNFFNGRRRLLSLGLMAAVLFEVTFVQQFRSTLGGMLLASFAGFLLWRKVSAKKTALFLAAVVCAWLLYRSSNFLQQSVVYLLSGDRSLSVRGVLIDFILENSRARWLLGSGWVSSEMAYAYASTPYRTYLNWGAFVFADGGVFSILYSYGALGVLWVAALWSVMLRKGWRIYRQQNHYLFLLFPLYMLMTIFIDIHWYIHDQFFVMALFCALLDYRAKAGPPAAGR